MHNATRILLGFILAQSAVIPTTNQLTAGVIFSDDFSSDASLANWVGIDGTPIPGYLGPIQEFSLGQSSSRSVASVRSLMPARSARGLWTVQSFDCEDIRLEAVFSPVSGIDGIFRLSILGDNGFGYSFLAGVFGARYGTYRFADAVQGWGLPSGVDGFVRKASGDDAQALDWTWNYGEWYRLIIQIDESSTNVSISSELSPTDSWQADLPQGRAWLGDSFRIGMVQNMFIPVPANNLWEANAMVDRVTLGCVPEPASLAIFGFGAIVAGGGTICRRKRSKK